MSIREERIGPHRLILGDCREALRELEAGSVRLLWTDPPYGHGNAAGDFMARRHEIMRDGNGTIQTAIQNDDGESMRATVDAMLAEAVRVLAPDCCCCCCCCGGGGGPSPTFAWVANRLDSDGLQFFHSVIWDKRNPGVGWRYRRQHEMVMIGHRRGGKLAWADDDAKCSNIVSFSKPRTFNHPNEKPLELPDLFIRLHSEENDTVLDPFMGSGTTGVACARLGRRFIGVEIEQKYFDIACRRIEAEVKQGKLFEQPVEKADTQLELA